MMLGPAIMARSLSVPSIPDKFGNIWQYHSQSDRHSKIACWAIMFDLLQHCPLLRSHIDSGKVGFGINHEMRDFQTNQKKNLDLVICTPRKDDPYPQSGEIREFRDFIGKLDLKLTDSEVAILDGLPRLPVVTVGGVNVALEAKAVMTAHIKALPRLHDELDSSHLKVHGHADSAIAAALVTVNIADTFVSTSMNKHKLSPSTVVVNDNDQPKAAIRTVAKIREIRRRTKANDQGFDALGIVVFDFKNDGSTCSLTVSPPAPSTGDIDHYSNMVDRISSLYASKFAAF